MQTLECLERLRGFPTNWVFYVLASPHSNVVEIRSPEQLNACIPIVDIGPTLSGASQRGREYATRAVACTISGGMCISSLWMVHMMLRLRPYSNTLAFVLKFVINAHICVQSNDNANQKTT